MSFYASKIILKISSLCDLLKIKDSNVYKGSNYGCQDDHFACFFFIISQSTFSGKKKAEEKITKP